MRTWVKRLAHLGIFPFAKAGCARICRSIRLRVGRLAKVFKVGSPWLLVPCRGVAKLVKALDFDSSMRRFESFLPCQTRMVVGLIEAY